MAPPRAEPLSPKVPRSGAVPPLKVGATTRRALGNGLEVMVVPRPTVPRVELRLVLPQGTAIGGSVAASELLRAGLLLGTRDLTQEQISESVQRLGGSIQVDQDEDRLMISASALSEAEAELYELVLEVATGPVFPEDRLETERVRLIEALRTARATPQFLAAERLSRLVYGSHPYGRGEPSEARLRAVSRERLLQLHRSTCDPQASQLTIVGDVEPGRTLQRLERAFAAWSLKGRRRSQRIPPVGQQPLPPLNLIDRPGLVQTVILIGASAPPVGHPDQIAVGLAAAVLGGPYSSRLMSNLREEKGYTYSPHAGAEPHLEDSLFQAQADVRTEVTAAAYVEFLHELGRLATVEVDDDELEEMRNYLAGVRVILLSTQAGLASSLAQLRVYGLDERYLEEYSQRLQELTPEELKRVSARYLAPARMTTVMVGDAQRVAGELSAVSPTKVTRASL